MRVCQWCLPLAVKPARFARKALSSPPPFLFLCLSLSPAAQRHFSFPCRGARRIFSSYHTHIHKHTQTQLPRTLSSGNHRPLYIRTHRHRPTKVMSNITTTPTPTSQITCYEHSRATPVPKTKTDWYMYTNTDTDLSRSAATSLKQRPNSPTSRKSTAPGARSPPLPLECTRCTPPPVTVATAEPEALIPSRQLQSGWLKVRCFLSKSPHHRPEFHSTCHLQQLRACCSSCRRAASTSCRSVWRCAAARIACRQAGRQTVRQTD